MVENDPGYTEHYGDGIKKYNKVLSKSGMRIASAGIN